MKRFTAIALCFAMVQAVPATADEPVSDIALQAYETAENTFSEDTVDVTELSIFETSKQDTLTETEETNTSEKKFEEDSEISAADEETEEFSETVSGQETSSEDEELIGAEETAEIEGTAENNEISENAESDENVNISTACFPDEGELSAFSAGSLKYTKVSGTYNYDYAAEVLRLVNRERAAYGLDPLKLDKKLLYCAMSRAAEVSFMFSHTRPNGRSFSSIVSGGFYYIGENIAAVYGSPESVMNGWMNSAGHRANILREGYRSIGIGCMNVNGSLYWVQIFSGSEATEEAAPAGKERVTKYAEYSEDVYDDFCSDDPWLIADLDDIDYSAVFDSGYYLSKYRDIYNAYSNNGGDAFSHFLNYGMAEGRQGNESFNWEYYKFNYPDIKNAYGDDTKKYYTHYLDYGEKEGRITDRRIYVRSGVDYAPLYDYDYYISHNADVKKAFGNDQLAVFEHFVKYGTKGGRKGNSEFDPFIYRFNYADLDKAYGDDIQKYYIHYARYGYKSGRTASKVLYKQGSKDYSLIFDFDYYINRYEDVRKAYGYDEAAVFKHFLNYGMKGGRQGSDEFNVRIYRAKYTDLRNAYGDDLEKYYMHYLNYGYKGGRTALDDEFDYSLVYDYDYYISHNRDVYAKYGNDKAAVFEHFMNYGMKGARAANESFNAKRYRESYKDLDRSFGDDWALYYFHYLAYGIKEGRHG